MEHLPAISPELGYIVLLFALFVLPRMIQRYRIPTAITSFGLGAILALGFGLFTHDPTVELLSTFGIVSLFLFAGLDVNVKELRRERVAIVLHLILRLLTLWAVGFIAMLLLRIEGRAAALVALALLTPSTGFILDSLSAYGLDERERFWVRSKAIATELVALGVLFAVLQSTTVVRLSISIVVLGALIALLPLAFHWFAKRVVPWAPKSEFAFLIMVAVVAAIVTRELGVYYLVGAFVVGMAAQQFRVHLPAMASEKMLHAVEAFASLFVPFYFFHAGLALTREDFGWSALIAGGVFVAIGIPLRIVLVAVHRRLIKGQGFKSSLRISVPLLPTLVFTLVIVQILRDQFAVPNYIIGGLIVYTIVNTLIPGLILHAPAPEYDAHSPWAHPLAGNGDDDEEGKPEAGSPPSAEAGA